MTRDNPAALIDSPALSEWLGVPIATLHQWAHRGGGPPFIRVGRHRRYDLAQVQQWLDAQTRNPEGAQS